MTIQLNAGKNLNIQESFGEKLDDLLTEELSRFSEHITRLEVHLSDENGIKEGQNDKRCMLEARLEGRQPIAVTANAETHEQSVAAAIDKLKNSLDTILERLRNH
ncbi:MAG: HPF/RaiA family ribosome-associated protein [Bacteroidia bacterium]|nr:HPF/RaiA family ribosome-associated protein [Bacteroidia bacterium]